MTKKLLNESTIRRFMTMANLAPLSENFIEEKVNEEEEVNENEEIVEEAAEAKNDGEEAIEEAAEATNEDAEATNEEVVEEASCSATDDDRMEEAEATNEEMDMDAEAEMDMDMPAEEPEMEMGAEEAGNDLASRAQDILADLADLLTKAGIETTVTSDEEEAMEDEMSDDAAETMDAVEDAVDAASEETDEEEVEMAEGMYGDEDKDNKMEALVAEITGKVMTRLNK